MCVITIRTRLKNTKEINFTYLHWLCYKGNQESLKKLVAIPGMSQRTFTLNLIQGPFPNCLSEILMWNFKIRYHTISIIFGISHSIQGIPADIYLLNVNKRNTRTRCEICSKLTLKTPGREHISHLVLVFLLLTLNMQLLARKHLKKKRRKTKKNYFQILNWPFN